MLEDYDPIIIKKTLRLDCLCCVTTKARRIGDSHGFILKKKDITGRRGLKTGKNYLVKIYQIDTIEE